MESIKQLPFIEFKQEQLATRDSLRELKYPRKDIEAIMIPFKQISFRKDFNCRTVYHEINELAESIKAVGLLNPIRVDVLKDGRAFVEQGHRRFMALKLLWEEKWLESAEANNISGGMVACIRNPITKTELERIRDMISSNHSVPLTPIEMTKVIYLLRENYGMTNADIGKFIGVSRQQIDKLLILAVQPDVVHNAIDQGVMKMTAAVELARKFNGSPSTLEKIVKEAVESGKILKQEDVKRMNADGEITTDGRKYTNNLGTYIGDDGDKAEQKARTTAAKVADPVLPDNDQDGETSAKGGKLTTTKDEETWCSDVIKDIDKMATMAKKSMGKDTKAFEDYDRIRDFAIKKMESIREFVRKSPAKSIK